MPLTYLMTMMSVMKPSMLRLILHSLSLTAGPLACRAQLDRRLGNFSLEYTEPV
jgi:hypothetical protein